ncbi:MAG: sarcosine oxidase subunit delta [Beijerinckiaceae bacterium]|jgi:sarcosine oxidase subunit delta|nr:sarcosine oxidase subunit delta [Beijerinckiaceae bacterium]
MLISCPHCGARDSQEFAYLGAADLQRPDGLEASLAAMTDYVYLRENPAGRLRELWYHRGGCGRWLVVTRDTRNHRIEAVEPARPKGTEAGA